MAETLEIILTDNTPVGGSQSVPTGGVPSESHRESRRATSAPSSSNPSSDPKVSVRPSESLSDTAQVKKGGNAILELLGVDNIADKIGSFVDKLSEIQKGMGAAGRIIAGQSVGSQSTSRSDGHSKPSSGSAFAAPVDSSIDAKIDDAIQSLATKWKDTILGETFAAPKRGNRNSSPGSPSDIPIIPRGRNRDRSSDNGSSVSNSLIELLKSKNQSDWSSGSGGLAKDPIGSIKNAFAAPAAESSAVVAGEEALAATAAEAASGLTALAGAAGPAVIALGAVAVAAGVLYLSFKVLNDHLTAATDKLRDYSAEISIADSRTQARRELANIDRARANGPALAALSSSRDRIGDAFGKIINAPLDAILRHLARFEPLIEKIAFGAEVTAEGTEALIAGLESARDHIVSAVTVGFIDNTAASDARAAKELQDVVNLMNGGGSDLNVDMFEATVFGNWSSTAPGVNVNPGGFNNTVIPGTNIPAVGIGFGKAPGGPF